MLAARSSRRPGLVAHDARRRATGHRAWLGRPAAAAAARAGAPARPLRRARAALAGARERVLTARAANTKHSLSELEARRLAPCRPVHDASPTAYKPGERGARVEVGRRSRPSCSARPARPGRARARGRVPASRSAAKTLGKWAGSTARMSSPTERSAGLLQARLDRARDLVARRELVDEALAAGVEQASLPRRGSPRSRGSPSRPGTPITAVGWNCSSSRSASVAPAAWASSSPTPCEPGGLVVRDHSAAAPPVAEHRGAAGDHGRRPRRRRRRSARRSRQSAGRAHALEHVRRAGARPRPRTAGGPAAGRSRCRRRAPSRRTEWPPSSPSASRPKRSASKRTPSRLQVAHARRRLVARGLRRRSRTASRPARSVSREVQLEAVVAPRAPPPARPAPSSSRSAPAASPTRAPRARPRGPRTAPRTGRPRPRRPRPCLHAGSAPMTAPPCGRGS